jgi:hypothetical protein
MVLRPVLRIVQNLKQVVLLFQFLSHFFLIFAVRIQIPHIKLRSRAGIFTAITRFPSNFLLVGGFRQFWRSRHQIFPTNFNALILVERNPGLWHFVGVQWVTDKVFRVDKLIFGRLLRIEKIDGGLFHRQGNFPSYGFRELDTNERGELTRRLGIENVDGDRLRLLYHEGGFFARGVTEELLSRCKWRVR